MSNPGDPFEEMNREANSGLQFHKKKLSLRGMLGFAFGVASCCGLLVLFILATIAQGAGPASYGYLGAGCLVLSVAGLILSILSLSERDIIIGFPIAGVALNGLLFAGIVCVYVSGL